MRNLLVLAMCGITALININTINKLDHYYPATLVVAEVNGNDIVAVTATNIPYPLHGDNLDIGDIVSVIMHDNNTPNDIRDDTVFDAEYSAFKVMFSGLGSSETGIKKM